MDHRFQLHDASGRSRYGGRFARRAIAGGHVEGSSQFRNKMSSSMNTSDSVSSNDSPPEGISVAFESRRNPYNKANGTPMKTLIHEEMSREKKVRQSSPSVIAKLMGLDSLPPPRLVTKQRETRRCLQKTNNAYYPDHSLGMSTREHQEFKDVFEIKDSRKVEMPKNQRFSQGRSHTKPDDMDAAFIRKKFMEAKRLSTDKNFQNSKEFNDALEVLDSNRDIFLKFLEEPNSFSTRHLQDQKAFPPTQHESHITVLKSSRGKSYAINDLPIKSQLKTERCDHMQNDPRRFLRKPGTNLFNHLLQEHSGSVTQKLSKAAYAGKTSNNRLSTRIVVLKPNPEKLQDNTRKPSSHENHPYGYRRHRNCTSDRKLDSRFSRSSKDETSRALHVMQKSNHSEVCREITDEGEYWNCNPSPSSSSTESFVSKESRKHLSECWRTTNRIQQARLSDRGSSTLGEMLGKDGWKDECSKNLPRYSSPTKSGKQQVSEGGSCYMLKDVLNLGVVDSSKQSLNQSRRSSHKSFKSRSYKARLNPGGEENKLPVREIHMNQKELKNNDHVSDRSEVNLSSVANSSNSLDGSSVTDSMIMEMPLIATEKLVLQPAQREESSGINQTDDIIKERSPSHPQMDPISSECGRNGSDFLESSNNAEKPNPLEEGESSPECFQKVSADLQELRKHLRLLRLETGTRNTELETPATSEDGSEPSNVPLYRSRDDRDRSYLIDVLRNVNLDNFEKLEEKYGAIVEWSRCERKLYFDLIGSVVEETLSPAHGKLGARVFGDGELVEEAWEIVLRLRGELRSGKDILDPGWLDLGGDIRTIGGEIGGMLMDEILSEFVYDFIR